MIVHQENNWTYYLFISFAWNSLNVFRACGLSNFESQNWVAIFIRKENIFSLKNKWKNRANVLIETESNLKEEMEWEKKDEDSNCLTWWIEFFVLSDCLFNFMNRIPDFHNLLESQAILRRNYRWLLIRKTLEREKIGWKKKKNSHCPT